ncbi:MAG: polysaccharide pyruvyl transferase family protein [Pseudomonadota bacterium]
MRATPVILFGAFDRHNLGDLLFPHVLAARYAGRPVYHAGLAERDMSAYGGHRVIAMQQVPDILCGQTAEVVHVGGELLTCDAYAAAVMLQTPEAARDAIRRYDALPAERDAWVVRVLGTTRHAPYVLDKRLLPWCSRMTFHCVGGVGFRDCPAAMRQEVLAALRHADAVTVRDRRTLGQLGHSGIAAILQRDAVADIARYFGERIREHQGRGEVLACAEAFPDGYLAVQFAAEYGDDATLSQLAQGIAHLAGDRLGVVMFRAGAAPWHDDLESYRRLAKELSTPFRMFESLNVWDICALLAGARAHLGSSLHGHIIARAFGVPALGLERKNGAGAKLSAWYETWEANGSFTMVTPGQVAKLSWRI